MFYIKCNFSNFSYHNRQYTDKFTVLFGKSSLHGIAPLAKDDAKYFADFLEEHPSHFSAISIVNHEGFEPDLYDEVRDYRPLPRFLVFDQENVLLKPHDLLVRFGQRHFIPAAYFEHAVSSS
jgi:hypothetical protein